MFSLLSYFWFVSVTVCFRDYVILFSFIFNKQTQFYSTKLPLAIYDEKLLTIQSTIEVVEAVGQKQTYTMRETFKQLSCPIEPMV